LALTATPGADVPRVQAVVDALHISRIEIREAEAPEIRKYMNEKVKTIYTNCHDG
jgi:ATP-dependent DNA helicase MPH1